MIHCYWRNYDNVAVKYSVLLLLLCVWYIICDIIDSNVLNGTYMAVVCALLLKYGYYYYYIVDYCVNY